MFQTDLLWQNDDRWANTPLGFGPETIKQWGCLTTSLTMVVNGCGYTETPESLSRKMAGIGAFTGAAINAYRLGEAFPGVALGQLVDCETSAAPIARIDAELAAGKPVVVRVDQSASQGIQDHWVVLYDKDNVDYLMLDPWRYGGDEPGKALHLTERYKYSGGTAAEAITSVIFFNISGKPATAPASAPAAAIPAQSAPAAKKPVPADAVTVIPTADAMAFRGSPSISGPLLRRFALNVALKSLEPRADTLAKIGVQGQWLNVQAPEGDQGYVAAWYVSSAEKAAAPAAAPAPAPAAAPQPAGFTVKVIEDQLAFRSQPVVATNNLITRFAVGTTLTVTDPDSNQKIGVNGQWLKVKDATGREGYVAAWYVSR